MNRSELALFKEGERWRNSKSFTKNAYKVMAKYGINNPIFPRMLPVEITKRLRTYYGRCRYGRWIKIAYYHWKNSPRRNVIRTLRHEYLHEWIHKNHKLVDHKVSYRQFEKMVYHTFGFEGDHGSYKYRYTGNLCRCWIKTNRLLSYWHCRCGKSYLKPSRYKNVKQEGSWYSAIKNRHIPYEELGILKKKILISV